jgi:diguanylate cyclase (GGDEF)-like protein
LGSWYLDIETDKVTWSEELFRMQGLEPGLEPPPASTHHQLFSPESWAELSAALGQTITEGKPYELELEMFNNGTFHGWMLARGVAIRDPQENIVGVLGVALDITDRKSREAVLRKKALQDPLTELGNRASFDVALAQASRLAEHTTGTFSLMFLDLDHFKDVNDKLGHDVGDRTLIALADRLRATLRGTDQIFRIGGDEFAVVLTDELPLEKIVEIGERVVVAFRKPLLDAQGPVTATLSIGLVTWDGSEAIPDLLRRADACLYAAKEAGRNRLVSQ